MRNINKKEITRKIFTLMLSLVLGLTMSGYTIAEAFAEDRDVPSAEEALDADEAETMSDEAKTADEQAEATQAGELANVQTQDDSELIEDLQLTEPEIQQESEAPANETEEDQTDLPEIKVSAGRDENFITAFWKSIDGAEYYMVYLNEDVQGIKVATVAGKTNYRYVFNISNSDLSVHTVTVEAYRRKVAEEKKADEEVAEGESSQTAATPAAPEYEVIAKGRASEISGILRGKLTNRNSAAVYTGLSLRSMLGEGNGGYAVAQGSATDGKYAYHVMASSSNQKGRIIKINISNSAEYYKGPVIGIHHANGMTYDSKRKRLVAVGYGAWKQQLTFIDPNSLTITSQQYLSYPYTIEGVTEAAKQNGIAAIAYIERYDVYVARSRGRNNGVGDSYFNNDIWVINAADLTVIGHVFAHVTGAYPETYQSMDADEKYVYYLLSPGGKNKKNIILCLDWNSENLLPVLKGDKDYVEYTWKANNNNTGDPDAVITIPTSHESEGLFHTTSSNGTEHFYVTEYYGRWAYKTITKKVKYKVKWKKVRKWYNKKTKKWTTKKPKKKYRGKSKKVWKYKTKTKKVKVQQKDYWARDDYVYDIGTF